MRVIRKFELLSLLLVATLFMQNASAGSVGFLPESSNYQGRTYYSTYTDEGLLQVRIDFAVYDTYDTEAYPDGFDAFEPPGDGQYIYAYQILCDTASTAALEYFAILEIGENSIDDDDGIGTQDDGYGGLDAYDAFFNPYPEPQQAVWEFDEGLLIAGEHSYFLVFTSDHNWKVGDFELIPTGGVLPPTTAPEPGMLTLLGIGGAMMFTKRRKSAQRYGVYLHN
jgi:hypothetical protein